jgi:hypothetical protein
MIMKRLRSRIRTSGKTHIMASGPSVGNATSGRPRTEREMTHPTMKMLRISR